MPKRIRKTPTELLLDELSQPRLPTAFDAFIEEIRQKRYHGHRGQGHSDAVSMGILRDLLQGCPAILRDLQEGRIRFWKNVRAPGGRGRRIDLFVGEATPDEKPDITKLRIGIENKSVVTAHRNSTNRYDELAETLEATYKVNPEAIMVATVMVGTVGRFLNVPDGVKKRFKRRPEEFAKVLPRLSSGDSTLWTEFEDDISPNEPADAEKSVGIFRRLQTRNPAYTHQQGYDFVLVVPVAIDNVNPPAIVRSNRLGIDVDRDYKAMNSVVCKAYQARWHM